MIFKDCFKTQKAIIGMVHLLPLPGSPGYEGDMAPVVQRALEDSIALQEAGFDGLIVENYNDVPYITGAGPLERTVAYTIALQEVKRFAKVPVGVNIQFNDFEAEIITAGLCNADFIRVEAYVDSVTTVGGVTPACAANLQRLKARLGFHHVLTFADVHVKEATLIGSPTLPESIKNAEQAGADAIIITGTATGQATPIDALHLAKKTTNLNILVGSGFNQQSGKELFSIIDGAIVGSSIKYDGKTINPVDPIRAKILIQSIRG